MTIEIDLQFVRKARVVPDKDTQGYVFADFFKDRGLQRAEEAARAGRTVPEVRKLLSQTYKGIDTEGIGVVWVVKEC